MNNDTATEAQLTTGGTRHARQCWNMALEPNWKRAMQGPAAFVNALQGEWTRLSDSAAVKVDIETGAVA